jgi:hypothetical protein
MAALLNTLMWEPQILRRNKSLLIVNVGERRDEVSKLLASRRNRVPLSYFRSFVFSAICISSYFEGNPRAQIKKNTQLFFFSKLNLIRERIFLQHKIIASCSFMRACINRH